jgi:hypothetical protein
MHDTTYFLPNILIVVSVIIDKTRQEGDTSLKGILWQEITV